MKTKLEMAHDWAMKYGGTLTYKAVSDAWEYADAMQAEADKREDKTRPEVLEEWQHIQLLEAVLLQYRRQHNIFEVGDLVTYKAHFKGMWREGFGKITEIDEDLEVVNIDENVGVAISEIEHATPEEIKAGHRL